MKHQHLPILSKWSLSCIVVLFFYSGLYASSDPLNKPMRRPLSAIHPMWVIHIDTWIWPDPQKAIDLVPEDIKPYVVFNISLSVSDFVRSNYPFSIAESWLRTCAENRVWATIQPASGYLCNFSYTELDVYEYFYKYPNFIGWNFAEQNWGFESTQTFFERLDLFIGLLKLADKYGGYLFVSNFMPVGNQTNALGKLKLHPEFAEACKKFRKNHIVVDKYTFTNGFYDNESANLGTFLSGYADHYGVRFDECGWESRSSNFPESTGAVSVLEHFMLTGATVTDGPELTWLQTLKSEGTVPTTNGYTAKKFGVFPQFRNISMDIFRKVIDGTVPILTKEEVIDRTKYIVVHDVNSANNKETYNSEPSLYTGVYAMDGELENNKTWYKRTGRYPAIPMTFKEGEEETGRFAAIIKKSDHSKRWPTIQHKLNELNALFPEEYTGDMYAARTENNWLIYNPFMDEDKISTGTIPLQYNSSDRIDFSLGRYSMAVMNEYTDKIHLYLNNYDTQDNNNQRLPLTYGIRRDIIALHGCTSQPVFTYTNRGTQTTGTVSSRWENNIFTLTVDHNGPMDITIHCAGNASGRKTVGSRREVKKPGIAPVYTGPRQYEAENFDYKSVRSISEKSIPNYTAMGYLSFGTSSSSAVRDTISVERTGMYKLITKYAIFSANLALDLYVNGMQQSSPVFAKTSTADYWGYHTETVELRKGKNILELRAKAGTNYNFFIDNIVVEEASGTTMYHFEYDQAGTEATSPAAENITLISGKAGVVLHSSPGQLPSKALRAYGTGEHKTGIATLDLFNAQATDYSIVWKQQSGSSGSPNGVLMRAGGSRNQESMKEGYLFMVAVGDDRTPTLSTYIIAAEGEPAAVTTYRSPFSLQAGQPFWLRATAIQDRLFFECSADSVTWYGASETGFADAQHTAGTSEIVWKQEDTGDPGWTMDNISYREEATVVSKFDIKGLNYTANSSTFTYNSFSVGGASLFNTIDLTAGDEMELSTDSLTGYGTTLQLPVINGIIRGQTVYVRLRPGLEPGSYSGHVSVSASGINLHTIRLSGTVTPEPVETGYTFDTDPARTRASNPPATDITVGKDNTATAGVVSYTDNQGNTSNRLRLYSGGQRNATGVLNLNRFPSAATDYSVSWTQCIETAGPKAGVLLRGDNARVGTASSGYVQGLMHGYLFIVYNTSNTTEFRIYRSDNTFNALTMLTNTTVTSLKPAARQPVWYKASVSGNKSVELRMEYSADGINWMAGTATTDNSSVAFQSGSTQFVWGLAASNNDFFVDDITFKGVTTALEPAVNEDSQVIAKEYYTITGQRIFAPESYTGVLIVRSYHANGKVQTKKIIL